MCTQDEPLREFTKYIDEYVEELMRDGRAEVMCTGWFKRMVLSTPGYPSPIVHPPRVMFEVREVNGRGLAVFATEDIAAGDLILAERPLVVKMIWSVGGLKDPESLTQEQKLRGVSDLTSYADVRQLTQPDVCGHGKKSRGDLLAHDTGYPGKVHITSQQPQNRWFWAAYWDRAHERV